jgi:hypothetical protein
MITAYEEPLPEMTSEGVTADGSSNKCQSVSDGMQWICDREMGHDPKHEQSDGHGRKLADWD